MTVTASAPASTVLGGSIGGQGPQGGTGLGPTSAPANDGGEGSGPTIGGRRPVNDGVPGLEIGAGVKWKLYALWVAGLVVMI